MDSAGGAAASRLHGGIPRARIYGYKVMLNPGDSTPLLEVVGGVGFTSMASASSGFVLGMDRAIEDGAARTAQAA